MGYGVSNIVDDDTFEMLNQGLERERDGILVFRAGDVSESPDKQ